MIDRRKLLISTAALGASTFALPKMVSAQAATDKRLLFLLQRGAADGLATLAPTGDPGFANYRAAFVDEYADAPEIGGMFRLHPRLSKVGAMFGSGEASFVHATATSYRDRSHFDGQNLLESGGLKAYATRDGWMNRMLGLLPSNGGSALALAPAIPLVLQGTNPVTSYAPSALPDADAGLMERVSSLYESDPQLSALWQEALKTEDMVGETGMRNLRNAEQTGMLAASLMSGADGARVMMAELNGWDSHAGQSNQLNGMFGRLDALLGAYRNGMGSSWKDTLVIVATEFGRTVAVNGTRGTDHGTGSAAMLLGGAVKGGQIIADWPGLRQTDLYQARDLKPITELEAVIAGAVAGHFSIDPELAMRTLFAGRTSRPLEGLIRS